MKKTKRKLNLGCGEHKKEGYINLDWSSLNEPEVLHDLNATPYPFENDSFDVVEAFHVLEHLDKPFDVMRELHRILTPGGLLHIKVPHFSRGFTHSEHEHGFDVTFPYYFNRNFTTSGFFGVEFDLKSMELHYMAFFHLLPSMGYSKLSILFLRVVNKSVSFLANLSPALTSRIWCFWVGGFEEIEFRFTKK